MVRTLLPEIKDQEALKALAESIGGFFDRLGIRQAEQRQLLGMENWAGAATKQLPSDPAVLQRVGHLLAIDRALQDLDAELPGSASWWMRTPQPMLSGQSPISVMLTQGILGMKKVRAILESGTTPSS